MTDLRSTPPNAQENELTLELVTQLCVGPSLSEVAADLLRQSLDEKYPDLNINPDTALMGTATWKLVDNRIVAGAPQYQTLSNILARQAITQLPTLCIEGEHFLTQQPLTDPATHPPPRTGAITASRAAPA
ncbi:hypothetical protein [Pseudomonas asgharzadehiana]|uniref:Uncharacterized protein n=1 Tax=Pseudomonas asgharzadehiana TaxID=2842349 RepID=A0ABX8P144_9PSED|nr:hypothetical protein [Pseudomonas asgharzadehiana]QXH67452.1 hypothetical protein KSS96_00505 [Pseudomonas asgharzadehiana]